MTTGDHNRAHPCEHEVLRRQDRLCVRYFERSGNGGPRGCSTVARAPRRRRGCERSEPTGVFGPEASEMAKSSDEKRDTKPLKHRPLRALAILLIVSATATVLWWSTEWTSFTLGGQLVASVIALVIAGMRRVRTGSAAAILGGLAGVCLWAGVRFDPVGGVETLTAAELPGRRAFGFVISDGHLLVDRKATASFEEKESCHEHRDHDCLVTYDYTAAPVVGAGWHDGELVPAWVVEKRRRQEQTILNWPYEKNGDARPLAASPIEWSERLTGAMRRGALSEPTRRGAVTDENAQRSIALAERKLGLGSVAGALILSPSDDPTAVREADVTSARWARRAGFGLVGLCAALIFGANVRARAPKRP